MSQSVQKMASISLNNDCLKNKEKSKANHYLKNASFKDKPINSVMLDISRLSESLANSYDHLEDHVEQLNDQLQDINEQKSEALEEKQKLLFEKQTITDRLQNLLAVLPSGVVVLDGKGIVRDCNAVAIGLLGRPLLGELWLNVINRAFLPQADDGHQISLKDGRKIHLETRALDSEPGQLIVLTDMTKTRQLQAELGQQQKLSSMGKMVASLAHQIRTPLSAATLYASHLNKKGLSNTKKQQFGENLMERLKFMERQISDMLNFVKGEEKEKKIITIEEVVESIQSACQSFVHKIEFKVNYSNIEDKALLADIDSLVGAISNLVDNAIDATDDDTPVIIKVDVKKPEQLLIQIIDSGKGIANNLKEKLFEPFYTTKNNGNGLGLAIVRTVVVEHGGRISVESPILFKHQKKSTRGSQFNIYLPLDRIKNDSSYKQTRNIY